MITANITLTCYTLDSSTSFGDTMHLVGNNPSMQPTPLWSVGKFTFFHDLNVQTLHTPFCPCYLFLS